MYLLELQSFFVPSRNFACIINSVGLECFVQTQSYYIGQKLPKVNVWSIKV